MASKAFSVTSALREGFRKAVAAAGLPAPDVVGWEVPREAAHGDYSTNVAMVLARSERMPPHQVAELIKHAVVNGRLPELSCVGELDVAGPGFLNVTLSPEWCRQALRELLAAGSSFGREDLGRGQRVRLEFVSANPTGPLVIVSARAAAVGDSIARILRALGHEVTTEFYVNDAGNQFQALGRSLEARVRQALGEPALLPEGGYPGEYLIEVADAYLREHGRSELERPEAERVARLGEYAVERMVAAQRRVLHDYGVDFDVWSSEQRDVRDQRLPEQVLRELESRGFTYERDGALWFRASQFGDEKDRVLRKSDGELTYFAVDIAYHHVGKLADADRLINLLGPDHHGYVARMRAAMRALGHPPEAFEVLMVQLVTLLRDGEPVRMSKRRGEFVLMEELIEEVGPDAARFTFLTRRHDSPLDFDLAVATRQTADNPVYYVQYAHARIKSLFRQAAGYGIQVPDWRAVDLDALALDEELALIKRLLQFPDLVAGAGRALEPHRIAYWLQELAGAFHPYYKVHRVISEDVRQTHARLALCAAVGQVIQNGLALLGVSAPETM